MNVRLFWTFVLTAGSVVGAPPVVSTTVAQSNRPPAPRDTGEPKRENTARDSDKKRDAKPEKKDKIHEEGYEYGFQQGEELVKSGARITPDTIILSAQLTDVMLRRLGPLDYERWEKGYLEGHKAGRAAGLAARDAAQPSAPAKNQLPVLQRAAPDGFGPLKLGMSRFDAHTAIAAWPIVGSATGPVSTRWEGMPVKNVWRFGVFFTDGYDLWCARDRDRKLVPARPEDIPPDRQDARIEAIALNYFNDNLPLSSTDVRDALFQKLCSVYGDPNMPAVGMWLWPKEDRYVSWDRTGLELSIGSGALARTAVKDAIRATQTAWQNAQAAKAAADFESTLRGAPQPSEPTASSRKQEPSAGALLGSWRIRGHQVTSGGTNVDSEYLLVLDRFEGAEGATGEFIYEKIRPDGPENRKSVRAVLRTVTLHDHSFRILTLIADSPSESSNPITVYGAILSADQALRSGTWSWEGQNNGTFVWEGIPIQEKVGPSAGENAKSLSRTRGRVAPIIVSDGPKAP